MGKFDSEIKWLEEIKSKTPEFLNSLKGKKVPGFYRYTLSGDLYGEDVRWGLGNTVFAVKAYYSLGILDQLPEAERAAMADFIKGFQQLDGTFYDPLIKKLTWWKDMLKSIRNRNFVNFFHKATINAETRQSISALKLLNERPHRPLKNIPHTVDGVIDYLKRLDWTHPWSAGSHFSHLLFFLSNSTLENKDELIDTAIVWVNTLQSREDGAWYRGNPTLQQKINGAMKIITGLKVADRLNFAYPEKLIDLCLGAQNDTHACDNFNITYVVHYSNMLLNGKYRTDEVKRFALNRLNNYKKYYYPEWGGFSFLPDRADFYYYGAIISKGLKEPDIHGTCMFLWGISIITQLLDLDMGFKEYIT